MTTLDFITQPAVLGLLVAIPSLYLGYLGYRRSKKADSIADQVGVLAIQSKTVKDVIDGLNLLANNLQSDNQMLRIRITDLDERLKQVTEECHELRDEVVGLKTALRLEEAK